MLTPEELKRIRSEAGRKGGLKRATQFTKESQQAARSNVKRESLQAAGSNGFQALYAKDPQAAAKKFADWRRTNPSDITRIVLGWLEQPYELEVCIGGYYADIVVLGKLIIRVNGTIWHTNNPLHGRDVEARDAAELDRYLSLGYTVLTLWEDAIKSGSAKSQLQEALYEITNQKIVAL